MAVVLFRGDYFVVAQVETITIGGTVAINDTFTVTINGKAVTGTATANTVANACSVLAAALAASTIPEFTKFTVTSTSTTVVLTGVGEEPFTISVSKVSTSGTIGTATTIAANGPNHYSAENMDGGSLPASGDTLYVQRGANIKYQIDRSGDDNLAAIYFDSQVSQIGLPYYNDAGYVEYLETNFTIGSAIWDIGRGEGSGPSLCKIDGNGVQAAVTVRNSGGIGESDNGFYAVQLRNLGTSSTVRLLGGSTDIAPRKDDGCTVATLSAGTTARFRVGAGVTLTNFIGEGTAQGVIGCATTTLLMQGTPSVVINGSGAHPTMEVLGGVLDYRSTGNPFGTAGSIGAAVVTFENAVANLTIAADVVLGPGASFLDPMGRVTFSGCSVQLPNTGFSEVRVEHGRNFEYTPVAL